MLEFMKFYHVSQVNTFYLYQAENLTGPNSVTFPEMYKNEMLWNVSPQWKFKNI